MTKKKKTLAIKSVRKQNMSNVPNIDREKTGQDFERVECDKTSINRSSELIEMDYESFAADSSSTRLPPFDVLLVYAPNFKAKGSKSIIENFNRQYRSRFERRLKLLGLDIQIDRSVSITPPVVFVKIRASHEFLLRTAELYEAGVAIGRNTIFEQPSTFSRIVNTLACLRPLTGKPPKEHVDYLSIPFKRRLLQFCLHKDNPNELFSPAQRSKLVEFEIEEMKVPMNDRDRRSGSVSYEEPDGEIIDRAITFQWLKHNNVYTAIYRGHDSDLSTTQKKAQSKSSNRKWLRNNWASFTKIGRLQPLDYIQQYFGSELTFYFAWLGFYTKMLIIPALLSLICLGHGMNEAFNGDYVKAICKASNATLCRKCPDISCHYQSIASSCKEARVGKLFDNLSALIFSVMLSTWAVAFQELWKRQQFTFATKWKSIGKAAKEQMVRQDYLHKVKTKTVSPITRRKEPHVRKTERARRLSVSFIIGALLIFVLIGNIIGLIIYQTVAVIIFEKLHHPLIDFIGPKTCTNFTASAMNLIFIQFMSYVYPKIAWRLTKYEFPRTQSDFDRSYTFKVVIFQFFNFYGTVLYLAFYYGKQVKPPHYLTIYDKQCGAQGCMSAVTMQLIVVSTGKQMLQNFTELASPVFKVWLKKLRHKKLMGNTLGKLMQWEKDYFLNDLPQPAAFNDYLEMIIQYGFITMFAPAFPLGAFFAWLNNLIEIRLDAYKYITKYRRPLPRDVSSIGPWLEVLEVITRLSVLVNAALIAFTSTSLEILVHGINYRNVPMFNFAFSVFDTVHYSDTVASNQSSITDSLDSLRIDSNNNETIDRCYYLGMFYGPEAPEKDRYTPLPEHYLMILVKLAFIVCFQNVVTFAQTFIRYLVPPQSDSVKYRIQREEHLHRVILTKYKQLLIEEDTKKRNGIETNNSSNRIDASKNINSNFDRHRRGNLPIVIRNKTRKRTSDLNLALDTTIGGLSEQEINSNSCFGNSHSNGCMPIRRLCYSIFQPRQRMMLNWLRIVRRFILRLENFNVFRLRLT